MVRVGLQFTMVLIKGQSLRLCLDIMQKKTVFAYINAENGRANQNCQRDVKDHQII